MQRSHARQTTTGEGPTATASPVQAFLAGLHARYAGLRDGAVADYIPELSKADPDWFGICLATTDGRVYEVGDTRQPFTIQSISKAIVYGMALEDRGREHVLARVGVEPSGEAFNAISLAPGTGRPLNPMINAGAIATAGMIAGHSPADRLHRILSVFSLYAGRPLAVDEAVYRSEKETGHRNRAIGHLLRNFDVLEDDPEGALDLYFRQCSIAVDCRDLGLMAATLANGGVHPRTGERALRHEYVESVLSVMTTCGMYDFAGEWVWAVGLPAKSGVGGGILAVAPGQLGIAVFSPPLDPRGNSTRGVAVCRDLARELNLHFLRVPAAARTSIRAQTTLAVSASKRRRTDAERAVLDAEGRCAGVWTLQGDLGFPGVEQVTRRIVDAGPDLRFAIVDFAHVHQLEPCAAPLFHALALAFAAGERWLVLSGAGAHAQFLRRVDEAIAAGGTRVGLATFADLDAALEWCENRILAGRLPEPTAQPAVPLAAHQVCAGLDEAEVAVLAPLLVTRRYRPGEAIIRRGDTAAELFLLASGQVSITQDLPQGARRRLSTASPGMAFGELAILGRGERVADVHADTPVECWLLPLGALDELRRTHPAIHIRLLENLLRQVHAIVRRLDEELVALR